MKRPAFQFYPADWRKDAALQSCSLAAQGLWINALCIAHECEPYGHLTINGQAMTAAQLGRLAGATAKEAQALVDELLVAGVASRTDTGVIFSRRMVRDEDLRNRRAEGGKGGAEHGAKGAEHGSKGGRPRKGRGVSEPPLEPPPSSSSSSSSSRLTAGDGAAPPPGLRPQLDPNDPDATHRLRVASQAGEPTPAGRFAAWLLGRERAAGRQIRVNPGAQAIRGWVENGVSHAELEAAYDDAVASLALRPGGFPLTVEYLDAVLRRHRAQAAAPATPMPSAAPAAPDWQRDSASMQAKAREIGLAVDPHWTLEDLRWHLVQRLRPTAAA